MANVSFTRSTTGATATGRITFDDTYGRIFLGTGSAAKVFGCISRVSTMTKTPTFTATSAGQTDSSYSFICKYTLSVPGIVLGVTGATTYTTNAAGWSGPNFSYPYSYSSLKTTLTIQGSLSTTSSSLPLVPSMGAIYITYLPLSST